MVKRRTPNIQQPQIEKKIEDFASGADRLSTEVVSLNSEAPRDYKAIRIPFNQYEYQLLEKLCKKTNRSKLNMMRYALRFYDENLK